jgi:hypothetical protein
MVTNNSDKQVSFNIWVGLYPGGGAYIWNEVSVSTCDGLIHGGLIFRGLYSDVYGTLFICNFTLTV